MANHNNDPQWIEKINAFISVHFGVDPEQLDDEQWALYFNRYMYVKSVEKKKLEDVLLSAFQKLIK